MGKPTEPPGSPSQTKPSGTPRGNSAPPSSSDPGLYKYDPAFALLVGCSSIPETGGETALAIGREELTIREARVLVIR